MLKAQRASHNKCRISAAQWLKHCNVYGRERVDVSREGSDAQRKETGHASIAEALTMLPLALHNLHHRQRGPWSHGIRRVGLVKKDVRRRINGLAGDGRGA